MKTIFINQSVAFIFGIIVSLFGIYFAEKIKDYWYRKKLKKVLQFQINSINKNIQDNEEMCKLLSSFTEESLEKNKARSEE
ncbi:MAG: hypothetical protein ACOCRK_08655 [bacterium]